MGAAYLGNGLILYICETKSIVKTILFVLKIYLRSKKVSYGYLKS